MVEVVPVHALRVRAHSPSYSCFFSGFLAQNLGSSEAETIKMKIPAFTVLGN